MYLDAAACKDPGFAARVLDVARGLPLGAMIAIPVKRGVASVLMDHLTWFALGGEIAVGVLNEEHFDAILITLVRRVKRGEA